MALIKCKDCGHTISDKALKCPKCGNPNIKEEITVVEAPPIVDEEITVAENNPAVEQTLITDVPPVVEDTSIAEEPPVADEEIAAVENNPAVEETSKLSPTITEDNTIEINSLKESENHPHTNSTSKSSPIIKKKLVIVLISIVAILLFIFWGVKYIGTGNNSGNRINSYDIAYNTLSSKNGILPSDDKELMWAIPIPTSNNKKILALVGTTSVSFDLGFELATIENIGGNWQVSNIDTQKISYSGGINFFKASSFNMKDDEMPKYVELNKVPYIFFMCREGQAGNAMPSCYGKLYFILYNLNTKNIVTLNFQCWSVIKNIDGKDIDLVEGEFVDLEKTKKNIIEAEYLLKQAELSAFIYRPSSDDLNMESPQNAEKKWLKDNPRIDNMNNDDSDIIKFTYYDIDEYYEEEIKKTITPITPNENYEIGYWWRGSVYALDKIKKKYFVVYGHESNWGAREVSWIDESTIEIMLDTGINLIVNLKSGNVHSQKRY